MFATLALVYAIQTHTEEVSRLRTLLPNGAVVLVTHRPTADKLIIQLAIADKNCPETATSNGQRHLLEHLMAKGVHKDVDRRLELRGAFLTAETDRDATVFTLNLKPGDLDLGLLAVSEISSLGEQTKEDIAKEAEIIREEVALEDEPRKFSIAAWKAAFGDGGLDPMGDPDRLAQVTPAQLSELHHTVFVGANVRLLIDGDVDLDAATKEARPVLELIPDASYKQTSRGRGTSGSASIDIEGAARAAIVPGASLMETAASLAAALAVGAEIPGCFVTYTPTADYGLVIVGKVGDAHDMLHLIDTANPDQYFALGRSLAKEWVLNREAGSLGTIRALMVAGDAASHPEDILENLSQMGVGDFRSAFAKFRPGKAVSVVGQ